MNYSENMTLQATIDRPVTKAMEKATLKARFEWPGRIALLLAIVLSPWFYGSVEFNAKTGIAIALVIGLALWWFETSVSGRSKQVFPYLFVPVAVGIAIMVLQLIPLPDFIANAVLGRQSELMARYATDGATANRISLNPYETWNYLGMVIMALAGLCLGCRYFRTTAHMQLLLMVCSINGVAIAVMGIIHKMTARPGYIFWDVPLLLGGNPFGPYVNRNSAAGYLLICLGCCLGWMIMSFNDDRDEGKPKSMGTKDLPFSTQLSMHFGKFLSQLNGTSLLAMACAVAISLGIVATTSRGGVLALLVGFFATVAAYSLLRKITFAPFVFVPLILLAGGLSVWLGFGDQLMERYDKSTADASKDVRLLHWIDTYPAVADMGWFGSGAGSYGEVHRFYRSNFESFVFAMAENQFFQTLVELGWPGLIVLLSAWLMAAGMAGFCLRKGRSSTTVAAGVAGVFVISSVGTASCFDFGIYMAANMLLMSVFCGFVCYQAQSLGGRLKKRSWLQLEAPRRVIQVILLALVACLILISLNFFRQAQVQRSIRQYPLSTISLNHPSLAETDRLIEEISPLVQRTRTPEGLNYVAELYLHRARMQQIHELLPGFGDLELSTDELTQAENLWGRTQLDLMQEQYFYLKNDVSPYRAAAYLQNGFIRDNLPSAKSYSLASRDLLPFQPFVHANLGRIDAVIGNADEAARYLENAVALAPKNGRLRFMAGTYYLQSGNPEAAAPHLKSYLETSRKAFKTIMDMVTGRAHRRVAKVDPQLVLDKILPNDPVTLYNYAARYLDRSDPQWQTAMERTRDLLVGVPASDLGLVTLDAQVKLALGDIDGAIKQFEASLVTKPSDYTNPLSRGSVVGTGRRFGGRP